MTHSSIPGTENDPAGSAPAAADAPAPTAEPLNLALGRELRAAREARKLDIEDCGHALKLPVRVLRKLEAGDYAGIDHGVYLRNYLTSYAACVGLPEQRVRDAIGELAPAERKPELVSTGGISRSHYLWQRCTTAATYIVLTAVIVVPLVWLGVKGGLDRELTHLEPLNSAPVAQPEAPETASSQADESATVPTGKQEGAQSQVEEQPLMASMAPFSALDSVDELTRTDRPARKIATPPMAVPGTHTLSIALTRPCWVEVTTADGERLAYDLFPAGTHKTWQSTRPFRVSIGNTTGATVLLDGKPVDLAAYQHANVAHFRVALEDGRTSVQAM